MIGDSDGPVVVISPHLDDAVLSAWSVLRADPSGEVGVVVVFAGVPAEGTSGRFDPVFGTTDSAALMRLRRQEDHDAVAAAGRRSIHLDHLDDQYRTAPPDPGELTASIAAAVDRCSMLVAPAGIGRHPDHLAARAAAVELAASTGTDLSLYADLPYATNMGWPSWVTGDDPDPHLVPDAVWVSTLAEVAAPEQFEPIVTHLDEPERLAKLDALRRYASQWPALEGGPHARISNPAVSAHEVRWLVHR